MEEEQWKDIPDFEGFYQASNFGRIRSLDQIVECRNGATRQCKGKVMKLSLDRIGYQRIGLSKQRKDYPSKVHKLIMLAFVGERSDSKIQVNHIDGDKANNNLSNLEYCSHSHNMRHASVNGLLSRAGGRKKFKNDDVFKICLEHMKGTSTEKIAFNWNVDTSTVRKILSNTSYKKVPRP